MSAVPGLGWAKLKNTYQAGATTLAVPLSIHKEARSKLRSEMDKLGCPKGICLLQGGEQQNQYDTDTEPVFRQDSWFNFLFGVHESEFYGAVDLETGRSTLFMPRLPEVYRIWCGSIHPPVHFKEMYDVDEVIYSDSLPEFLESRLQLAGPTPLPLYLLSGVNSDSGLYAKPAHFEGIEKFEHVKDDSSAKLHHALSTARVTKNKNEVGVMHYCAWVASNAHVETMRHARPNTMEYQLEARFLFEIYNKGGCRKAAYTSICACGPNNAVLHYGHAGAPNDRLILPGEMALCDMGAEYHGYVSDITCTFPLGDRADGSNRSFTPDQRGVYQGVLDAQVAVYDMMRPGTPWPDCHHAAYRCILSALVKLGVLQGDINDMIDAEVGAVFMPHGLGHLIGCDTHDVGGYLDGTPTRSKRPGFKSLRTARPLEAGMALTNEPGCYFIDTLLDAALASEKQQGFFNETRLREFRGSGGVRLEDVVLVTEDGVVNLTTCPRTLEEVESVCNGGAWPPKVDACPALRRRWASLAPDGTGMVHQPLPPAN